MLRAALLQTAVAARLPHAVVLRRRVPRSGVAAGGLFRPTTMASVALTLRDVTFLTQARVSGAPCLHATAKFRCS
jgi:hypothetical protein